MKGSLFRNANRLHSPASCHRRRISTRKNPHCLTSGVAGNLPAYDCLGWVAAVVDHDSWGVDLKKALHCCDAAKQPPGHWLTGGLSPIEKCHWQGFTSHHRESGAFAASSSSLARPILSRTQVRHHLALLAFCALKRQPSAFRLDHTEHHQDLCLHWLPDCFQAGTLTCAVEEQEDVCTRKLLFASSLASAQSIVLHNEIDRYGTDRTCKRFRIHREHLTMHFGGGDCRLTCLRCRTLKARYQVSTRRATKLDAK